HRITRGVHQRTLECAGRSVVRIDLAIPEVANQYIAAERPKSRRSHRNAPRRIKRSTRSQTLQHIAIGVENVYKSPAARQRNRYPGSDLRELDVQLTVQGLNIER